MNNILLNKYRLNNKLMRLYVILLNLFICCITATTAYAQSSSYDYPTATQNITAFPNAEGFGKYTTGGRGGKVVTVTNLEDDVDNPVEGSLRWALAQYPDEPITVVFDVSGWIILKDALRVTRTAGLTIAGQTAPGEGITLYPRMFSINGAKNIIVRNMRFRTGSHAWDGTDLIKDAETVDQALCAENTENVIFDHCTFGWSAEEIVNNQCSHFTTFSYCLLHEGLYDAGHHKGGARSFACQWGGSQSTFHHNMLAHNNSRSPRFQGARDDDFIVYNEYVNNVNFNWGKQNACYGGENNQTGRYKGHQVNFVNNYYRYGPATTKGVGNNPLFMKPTAGTSSTASEWYVSGNYMDNHADITADNSLGVAVDGSTSSVTFVDEFIVPSKFYPGYSFDWEAYTMKDKLETAEDAYQTVLDKVGCIVRDSIERRIIRECKDGTATFGGSWGSGTYGIIDDQTDAEMVKGSTDFSTCPVAEESQTRPEGWDTDGDGMPDEWETANGFDPNNAEDGNYINAEGYTALEKYLSSIMGEEIIGTFGDATSIRVEHAVKFNISINNGTLLVTSDSDVCKVHVFDEVGRCRLVDNLVKGTNTVNVSHLSKGIYIVWVTDKDGYRNAMKFTKNI